MIPIVLAGYPRGTNFTSAGGREDHDDEGNEGRRKRRPGIMDF